MGEEVDEFSENMIKIDNYNDIELDRYYYDIVNEKLYMQTMTTITRYKIIKPYLLKNIKCINIYDSNGKKHRINYTNFINELNDVL